MFEGTAEKLNIEFKQLAKIISDSKVNEALGFGVFSDSMPNTVPVYSRKRMINGSGGIVRSKEFLTYEPQPGVIMFDYDPGKGRTVLTPAELIHILSDVHEGFKSCAKIITTSNSSGVSSGDSVAGSGGIHIYIPVYDASDIPRFGKVIFDKLWLKGHGYIELAKNGAMLVRSLIDVAVFSPERLDFVSPPILADKRLKYSKVEPKFYAGGYLDTNLCTDIPPTVKKRLEQTINQKKAELKPQQNRKIKEWSVDQVKRMVESGTSEAQAKRTISSILEKKTQALQGGFVLYFTDYGPVTVDKLVSDMSFYDGKTLADPVEGPEYGRTTAIFYANLEGSGKPFINSMAHGGCKYFIQEIDETKPIRRIENPVLDRDADYNSLDLLQHVPASSNFVSLVKSISSVMYIPASTVFLVGLSAYSALTSRAYSIRYEHGGEKPIGLYCIAEQPPGASKTRCLSEFLDPISEVISGIYKENRKQIAILEEKNNLDDDDLEELKRRKKAIIPPLYHTNSTPESIERELDDSNGHFAAVSSEQGMLNTFLGFSYASDSFRTSNNDLLLNGFDGGWMHSSRVTRKGYSGKVIAAVCLFAQPGSIEKIMHASNGTGLSERFLMLSEPHNLGVRSHKNSQGVNRSLIKKYSTNVAALAKDVFDPDNAGKPHTVLHLSGEGYDMIYDFRDNLEPRLADGKDLSHMMIRGAVSKIDMQVMKIAANLHLIDQEDALFAPVEIHDRHVRAAIGIANDMIENMLKLCGMKVLFGEKAEQEAIIKYLEKRSKPCVRREIVNSMRGTQPFKSYTGSKFTLVNDTIDKMILMGEISETHLVDGKVVLSVR